MDRPCFTDQTGSPGAIPSDPNTVQGAGVPEQLSYCAGLVRRHDHDRFLTALFAPEPVREHLWVLYAFNIEIARIRELVSEPLLGEIRLQWWREGIDAIYAGHGVRTHPVLEALEVAVRLCALPRRPFDSLIDAHTESFSPNAPVNLEELENHADAASAGVMRLAMGIAGGQAPDAAIRHAGIGWALTGVLRNIGIHASRRQVFLPGDMMRAEGLEPESVFSCRHGPELRRVMVSFAQIAGGHLAAARQALPAPSRQIMPVLLPITLADIYLRQIRRPDHDPFRIAAPIPAFRRQARLLWAMLTKRF
ncbi:MAG: phytoene/squalene synthase family protein [Alphaproteobacteria bacterium]